MNNFGNKLIVFIAQGFGIGRIPFAPGTWGTLLGFLWFGLLITGGFRAYIVGIFVSVLVAVWICSAAERILGQRDPASVVFDEIVAVPICFLGLILVAPDEGVNTGFMQFISQRQFLMLITAFALFRLFDIWKPWPIRQSQCLPGGWGIVIDDVLAAVYVNLVMLAVWFFFR